MPRSVKIHPDRKQQVISAIDRNGFLTQGALAANLGIVLSTLSNFINSKSVSISTFEQICEKLNLDQQEIRKPINSDSDTSPEDSNSPQGFYAYDNAWVGREKDIKDLSQLVNLGAKVIVIQGMGGIGKTTLAESFFKFHKLKYLKLRMATATSYINPVGDTIDELLREIEEPSRNFRHKLQQLKRQIQTGKLGILIDNLEPALDKHGKFIEPHRDYLELLAVLCDPSVQSVTLITSREFLEEPGITFERLPLKGLNEQAWEQFFCSQNIQTDTLTLNAIHKAYGGNALAMTIVCDPIKRYRNLADYWQQHKTDDNLLVETRIENLIEEQFNRLEEIYPEAYRLLCRLACYRYQDVPSIPIEGLLCLLWDVPKEQQQKRVVKSLEYRSLVELSNKEYYLHPAIQALARARLESTDEWEIANRKVAEYYFDIAIDSEDKKQVKAAFEAFKHFYEIQDFNYCCETLLYKILGANNHNLDNLRCSVNIWNYTNRILKMGENIVEKLPEQSKLLMLIPIGVCYSDLGKNYKALKVSKEIIEITERFGKLYESNNEEIFFAKVAAYSISGRANRLIGKFQESLDECEKAMKTANDSNLTKLKALALYELGRAYIDANKPGRAVICFVVAAFQAMGMTVSEEARKNFKLLFNIPKLLPQIENLLQKNSPQDTRSNNIKQFRIIYSIAQCFNLMPLSLHPLAEFFAMKALKLAESADDKSCKTWAYLELAICYSRIGAQKKASSYYEKAENNLIDEDETFVIVTVLSEIAKWDCQQDRDSSESLEKLEKLLQDTDFHYLQARVYYTISLTYYKLGRVARANSYCDRALSIATELGIPLAKECQELKEKLLS